MSDTVNKHQVRQYANIIIILINKLHFIKMTLIIMMYKLFNLKPMQQKHILEKKKHVMGYFYNMQKREIEDTTNQVSEPLYHQLMKQSLQGIVVVIDSKIVFANEPFAQMTGYTIKELKSLTQQEVSLVLYPSSTPQNYPQWTSEITNWKPSFSTPREYKNKRKDGAIYWYQAVSCPVQYGGKNAIQIATIDVTERKIIEEALIESKKMYQTLLDASPVAILIIDLSGHIIEVSSIAPEIFGVDNKNILLGKPFMHFVHEDSKTKVKDIFERTMSNGLEQDIEFIFAQSGHRQLVGEISTTLIQEQNGTPQSFMALIRDISQRKEMEKQLIHSERMAGLGEMATGIAHEINQPLNTISMSLENMLFEISNKKNENSHYLTEKINRIFDSIYRIGKIIDHIRTFSRDQNDYIPSAFDINESIKNALSLITVQYKHKAIDIITQLDDKLPTTIGNTFRFEQVILNLVINAKDALEDPKLNEYIRKTITIRTFTNETDIIVEVEDNGIGIQEEDIEHIMLPFYSSKQVGKGTGMGLAISFGIIEEMKGNIVIESKPEKGTVVRIKIPL
ncbi:PAS domain S-box protein [Prolixibacteraceae bacterium JC049]|nr:PAS domain S-box protein [Prolixibacteraceae bacterium JC049]